MQSYSWLRGIAVKGQQAKLARAKGAWGGVGRKPGASSQASLPSGITQDVLNSPGSDLGQHRERSAGKLIGDEAPTLFMWGVGDAGHIGILCLFCSKTPDFQKESRCLA